MTVRMLRPFLFGVLIAASAYAGQATLAERYRAGRIVLRIDEDWTSRLPPDLVFETRGDVAVAPDGSVFISNTTRHTIYKFDAVGKFVKRFGQSGQGPGDLTYPGRLSILDGKLLVVGEYASNQRISLFDLDGKFVKIVATGRFTSQAVALKDGKIAYVSVAGRMEPTEMISVGEVFVLDWRSGAQKSIVRHEFRNPLKRMRGGGVVLAAEGAVVLAPTRDGGLVVGTTQGAGLDIFAPDGAKIRTIDVGWSAIPVTPEYRKATKDLYRRQAEAEGRRPPASDPLLPEALAILQDIWTDAQGNILACKKTECLEDCPLVVLAYSPGGDLIGEFSLDPGPLVLSADWRFKRIVVTETGLFGLLELKDDPDGFLHLVRTVFRPE